MAWTTPQGLSLLLTAIALHAALTAAQSCPAPWRKLPLASNPATLAQLDIANWRNYAKSLIPQLIGPAIALVAALILLLSFLLWRLVKCCVCCICVRGKQRSGKKAHKLLAGSGAHWSKALVVLAAAGLLAGSVYGITQVKGTLVDGALAAVDAVVTFIEAAIAAGSATVEDTQALDTQMLSIRSQLQNMATLGGPAVAALTAPYIQAIDDTHSTLGGFMGFQSSLDSIHSGIVDPITSNVDQYTPLARTADKWRAIVLYIVYAVLAGLAVLAAFSILINWPAVTKPLVLLLLVLLLLCWIVVLVLTVALRVGNDVCVNVEGKALELVGDSGSISLGGGPGSATPLIQYYLYGTGGSVEAVVLATMGVDIQAALDTANSTLVDLQDAIQSTPALLAIADDFEVVQAIFANVSADVDALLVALSYSAFHPVYQSVKGFVCCDTLNSLGNTWSGLTVAGSFGLILMILAFSWIGRIDQLRALGCCHIYSARDYSLEGHNNSDDDGSPGGPAIPGKAPSQAFMVRKEGPPPSPTAGGSIKAGRVVPFPTSPGAPSMYPTPAEPDAYSCPPPAVGAASFTQPTDAFGLAAVPDEDELRAEAQRACQLAGQAYSMASQAQSLLEIAARTSSRLNRSFSNAGPSARGPGAGHVPTSRSPSWTSPPHM